MVTDARAPYPTAAIRRYLRRVVQRPRAWLLGYLLTLIPSAALALLTALPLLPLARYPFLQQILETHSLDPLIEIATLDGGAARAAPLGTLALLLIPVAWIGIRLMWVYLEGSTLTDYATPERPTWRAFAGAGWRWFGPFLLINVTGTALTLLTGAITLLLVALTYTRLRAAGWAIGGLGLALGGLLATWTEVARATALVHNERRAFHALARAARLMARRFWAFLALVAGGLAIYGALILARRWALQWLPLPWWLPALIIQQLDVAARMGVRLARQAGEVGLVSYPANRSGGDLSNDT